MRGARDDEGESRVQRGEMEGMRGNPAVCVERCGCDDGHEGGKEGGKEGGREHWREEAREGRREGRRASVPSLAFPKR